MLIEILNWINKKYPKINLGCFMKLNMGSRSFLQTLSWILFVTILLVLLVPITASAISNISVQPDNSTVGEQSIYTVTFTTGAVWPADGKL
ncbi:hypothetical protein B5M50_00965, partial [candidate division KSB1 bacterium 4484_219]